MAGDQRQFRTRSLRTLYGLRAGLSRLLLSVYTLNITILPRLTTGCYCFRNKIVYIHKCARKKTKEVGVTEG